MKNNYNDSLTRLLKDEGGYSNDPSDSGGATNYGITIGDYQKYINPKGTATDVKNMTVDQAKNIYKTKYWNALNCDNLESGVDYTVFDYGVNSGLARPKADLIKFANKKGADLINAINDERQAFLNQLAVSRPKDQKFLKGWTARVARVRAASLQMNKSPSGAVAGTAGGAVVAGGAAMAGTPHHYWPWIMGGIAASLMIAGFIYLLHSYEKNKVLNNA